ncbi:MAG: 50S ribosomal protein L10 [Candidatus Cloacimonetes bacterium]|nr:50S ribosomal protein L10 [Candidatus Cloacimonadota bacterium]
MVQPYKNGIVNDLKTRLKDAAAIVLLDYKGINIEEVNQLRSRFRKENIDYLVQKNTLIKIALHELGIENLDDYLKGPTALAICKTDEIAPARILVKFLKDVMEEKEFPSFKAGFIAGNLLNAAQMKSLSALPSREELIGKVLGCLQAPISGFMSVTQGIIRKFVYAIDAVAKQK